MTRRPKSSNAETTLYLRRANTFSELILDATNHHPFVQPVEIIYGPATFVTKFNPGERKEIVIAAAEKASQLIMRTRAYTPASDYLPRARDSRSLGIFVRAITYR